MQDKKEYLLDNHYSVWIRTWRETEEVISASQSVFCVCGKLATGLHEQSCRRFSSKVDVEAVKKLEHLLVK